MSYYTMTWCTVYCRDTRPCIMIYIIVLQHGILYCNMGPNMVPHDMMWIAEAQYYRKIVHWHITVHGTLGYARYNTTW